MRRTAIIWLCATTLALAQTPAVKKTARTPVTDSGKAASTSAGQATPAASATPAAEARQRQTKVFDVKYADVQSLTGLLNDLRQGSSPDRVIPQPGLHAIAIEAYSLAFLQSAEELIRRYDVPAMSVGQNHDFEIVAHILVAGRTPVAGDALPADLEAVGKQLKETFGYTDVKLIDSALEHAREGRDAMAEGSVNGLSDGATMPAAYEMSHQLIRFEPSAKKGSIALYGFKFKLRVPYMSSSPTVTVMQWQDVVFQTDLNIPDGQSVIVGKSKIGTENKSLVIVVKARTVE